MIKKINLLLVVFVVFSARVACQEPVQSAQEELYSGIQYFRKNDFVNARRQFEKVISAYPRQQKILDEAFDYLGQTLVKLGEIPAAIESYGKISRKTQKAYQNIFALYEKNNDMRNMVAVAEEMVVSGFAVNREIADKFSNLKLRETAKKCYDSLIKKGVIDYPARKLLWIFPLHGNYKVDTLAVDVNGDGLDEIIGCSDHIFCINPANGNVLWQYPADCYINMTPLVFDIDRDNLPDMVFISGERAWALRGKDGSLLWQHDGRTVNRHDGTVLARVAGNFNGDDIPDVAFDTVMHDAVCLNGRDGTVIWNTNLYVYQSIVFDENNDGIDDLIAFKENYRTVDNVSYRSYYTNVYNGKTGVSLFQRPFKREVNVRDFTLFCDVNNDNRPEIVFSTGQGEISAITADTKELWVKRFYFHADDGGHWCESVLAADVDDDPQKEVILTSPADSGFIAVLDGISGDVQLKILDEFLGDNKALADYDEDKIPELFCSSRSNAYGSFNVSAESVVQGKNTIWDFPCYVDKKPIIMDVDNDKRPELVGEAGTFLYAAELEPVEPRERRVAQ